MKNKPVPNIALPASEWSPSASGRFFSAWSSFWFSAVNPVGLHVVRVFTGLLLLGWLLPLAGHVEALFSMKGWVDSRSFIEASRLPQGPPAFIGWSLLYPLAGNPSAIVALYWATIAVFVCFTLGLFTRVTAVLTWALVVSFIGNPAARLEVDYMLVILTFYLAIGYQFYGQLNGRLSLVERALGPWDTFVLAPLFRKQRGESTPSFAANVALRLFQVHFALIVVTSGLHKLQSGDWWSGVGFWYPLHPPFETTEQMLRQEAPTATTQLFFYSLIQYIALAWQLSFPLWVWRSNCRPLLLVGGVAACLGSALLYREPLFGVFFLIGCLSYVSPEGWLRFGSMCQASWRLITGKESTGREHKMVVSAGSSATPR